MQDITSTDLIYFGLLLVGLVVIGLVSMLFHSKTASPEAMAKRFRLRQQKPSRDEVFSLIGEIDGRPVHLCQRGRSTQGTVHYSTCWEVAAPEVLTLSLLVEKRRLGGVLSGLMATGGGRDLERPCELATGDEAFDDAYFSGCEPPERCARILNEDVRQLITGLEDFQRLRIADELVTVEAEGLPALSELEQMLLLATELVEGVSDQ